MSKDRSSEFSNETVADLLGQGNGAGAAAISASDKEWFGHPRGLATLFFTEMWERFSYYGMRALLTLFMVAPVAVGGLGFDVAKAGAIYGLYTAMVYLSTMPGGWIADRILGQRNSVFWGGVIITAGHFAMAFPSISTFYLGLALIVVGTGLLKPNISVMVGQLYSEDDARRDAGFSIFYMGINLGAFLAPLACGFLAQSEIFREFLASVGFDPAGSWHWAFGLAGVGMMLGLVQYVFGKRYIAHAGNAPAASPERSKSVRGLAYGILGFLVLMALIGVLAGTGVIAVTAEGISNTFGVLLFAIVIGFFTWLFTRPYWTRQERGRLYLIGLLFVGAALFWSAFEQAGTTLNLFADVQTDRDLGGFEIPSSWFQSLNALFIIMLAPVFAWLWVFLARRKKEPGSPAKFGFGLLMLGLGFVVLAVGSIASASGVQVSPMWLVVTYLLHTIGELTLSPVGLSAMTKLAPARVTSLMMGVWFLGTAVGNYMGGFMARFYETLALPVLFGVVAAFGIGAAVVFFLLVKPMNRMLARSE